MHFWADWPVAIRDIDIGMMINPQSIGNLLIPKNWFLDGIADIIALKSTNNPHRLFY